MKIRACKTKRGFTLIELLVVIGIIALLATIGVGALKGFNAVNVVQAGNRQLLDDINRARNAAQNERTTVYMVFVPPLNVNTFPINSIQGAAKKYLTNRFEGQLTSYNFVALRSPGDQPGRGRARYLSEWKNLPNGVFINTNEFVAMPAKLWLNMATAAKSGDDLPFTYIAVPFPTATNELVELPCIAFDYRGALVGPDPEKPRRADEILSLTKGSLILPRDPATEKPNFTGTPEIIETPKGNTTNNPKIRIDWITGRARMEGV
ncbi:MAG TPA: prepilin-type N-terminal cleavage/methylation domain-containing protein [Verrucomicrobiae bacterium]|nr:prepilin-type N-terminal cleavage/methylation domain-containing protein [Verrucomicrobiae bacterium]